MLDAASPVPRGVPGFSPHFGTDSPLPSRLRHGPFRSRDSGRSVAVVPDAAINAALERARLPLVRRVNNEIRELSPDGLAPFFCECRGACFHAVWLDLPAYDRVIEPPLALVLAAGHRPWGDGVPVSAGWPGQPPGGL
jgi:hypothetical protein